MNMIFHQVTIIQVLLRTELCSQSLYFVCTHGLLRETVCYSYEQTGREKDTPIKMKADISASAKPTLKKSAKKCCSKTQNTEWLIMLSLY